MNNFKRMGTILSGSLLAGVLLAGPAQAAIFNFSITGSTTTCEPLDLNLDGIVDSCNQGTNDGGETANILADFEIVGHYDTDSAFVDEFGELVIDFNDPFYDNSWAVTNPSNHPLVSLIDSSNGLFGAPSLMFFDVDLTTDAWTGMLYESADAALFVTPSGFDLFSFSVLGVIDGVNYDSYGFLEYSQTAANTVVPVPAAVWLFGSALLGLVGFNRRKPAVAVA
jgi:hypothetical protein